ncbi:hypothetical protein DFJ58DRAFT_781363 [Suillus subalutaceus]|uniref:uncharacterized protein n=1 Tax=Suillus subalutaceus TaxID=48586 RepID=UPI001B881CD5|nr:uncharacterized protein DFJ58DRAFT_781363 [Suillus subalutaceus]KAG1859038.1 hypothetical protein DFJ58DRAFT_781363 [Suillus subalutaceus]
MGSSSSLDLNTSLLSNILSPPSTPDASQMLIPPAFDLLHFLPSSLLNHGKLASAERIVSFTLLYIHVLTYAPPLSAMLSSLLPPVSSAYHRSARERMS